MMDDMILSGNTPPADEKTDKDFNNIMKRYEEALKEKCINLWAIGNMVSLIIEDENSTIRYGNQTNGHACYHPEIKGYLVPVAFKEPILEKFMNYGYEGSGWELDKSFYDDAPEILRQLNNYFYDDYVFELDESKIKDNTEAWIHLVAKRIKPEQKYHGVLRAFPDTFNAMLTWPNSD